ncbi:hypothetical protein [Sulfurimonas sp.]|uniref:hypothetical protein n=1 Tax=Sulfurimonas sp. TaxID=2022749 RepID=UPI0025E0CE82|nr:hypothetical protein [Sulfurimonas sp.]MCK9454721.1 hypothetical protein [Sulfurimonas sp.]
MIDENIQGIINLIAIATPITTMIITSILRGKELSLKEKEILQKITLNKQQELFSKEIEIYQKLYLLAINYNQQKHQIGLQIPHAKIIQYETDYSVYVPIVRQIFHVMQENIFYMSKKLDTAYQELFDLYEAEFMTLSDSRRINYNESPTTEEEELLLDAQKRFYTKNQKKIENFIELIKNDFKEKQEFLKG